MRAIQISIRYKHRVVLQRARAVSCANTNMTREGTAVHACNSDYSFSRNKLSLSTYIPARDNARTSSSHTTSTERLFQSLSTSKRGTVGTMNTTSSFTFNTIWLVAPTTTCLSRTMAVQASASLSIHGNTHDGTYDQLLLLLQQVQEAQRKLRGHAP